METTLPLKQMTFNEKLRTLEIIWDDLCHSSEEIPSPTWHQDALKETEERVSSGKEQIIDWEKAKQVLRKQFQ